jgi:hypothetical protein
MAAMESKYKDKSEVKEELKSDTMVQVLTGIKYIVSNLPKELGKAKKNLLSMVSYVVVKEQHKEQEEGEVVIMQLEQGLCEMKETIVKQEKAKRESY